MTLYTDVPRTILWLVPGGEHEVLAVEGREPGERVEIEPFYLGKFPVTNEQYEAFDPAFDRCPEARSDGDPALGVSREDAEEYCRWYAEVSRKPMRLPSELEWEYAACGGVEGNPRPVPEEMDALAWHSGNCSGVVPRLRDRRANGFGLYGMLGGVLEWVAVPPGGPAVVRGCSWREDRGPGGGARRVVAVGARPLEVGFRVAKSLR